VVYLVGAACEKLRVQLEELADLLAAAEDSLPRRLEDGVLREQFNDIGDGRVWIVRALSTLWQSRQTSS
jgi:cell division protein ZapA (FtsZ GTPase activity inhibitor)